MSVTSSERSKKQRSKKWEFMEVPPIDELEALTEDELAGMTLPAGFCIRFFCHDMHYLYTVASQQVVITRGIIDYLHDFNQLGPNKSRNKLFLCSQYDAESKCRNGSLCREVHCRLKLADAKDAALYHVSSNATGAPNAVKSFPGADIIEKKLNDPCTAAAVVTITSSLSNLGVGSAEESAPVCTVVPSTAQDTASAPTTYIPEDFILIHSLHSRWTSRRTYSTLPAGVTFCVALPNTPTPVDAYDSENILVTRGAKEYYDAATKNEPLNVTMQHCAHYSKNGTCCFGEDCQFVHVLHYRARERGEYDGSCSDGDSILASSLSSSAENSMARSRAKRNTTPKETPLSFGQDREPVQAKKSSASSSRSASTGNGAGAGSGAANLASGSAGGGVAASGTLKSATAPAGANPMGAVGQPQGSPFLVPPAPAWMAPGAQAAAQQPLLFPSFQMQQPVQQGMQQTLAPQMMMSQPSAPLMMMRGPNGEMYLIPQGTQPSPQGAHQPFYMMPMPSYQGS